MLDRRHMSPAGADFTTVKRTCQFLSQLRRIVQDEKPTFLNNHQYKNYKSRNLIILPDDKIHSPFIDITRESEYFVLLQRDPCPPYCKRSQYRSSITPCARRCTGTRVTSSTFRTFSSAPVGGTADSTRARSVPMLLTIPRESIKIHSFYAFVQFSQSFSNQASK